MKVTKSEFVDRLSRDFGSKREAEDAVDSVITGIQDVLGGGGEVNFTGFGKFHVAQRGARQGKHPRTGEPIHIPASRVPRFSAGAKLKQAVNN
jgi:DNA-binding protein HU-beta